MLPLPRFATRPWFFGLLALLHIYMGGEHLLHLVQHPISWTDTWKGFGAIFGAYYFIALALRSRTLTGARGSLRSPSVGS
jgi:hypothetical protein